MRFIDFPQSRFVPLPAQRLLQLLTVGAVLAGCGSGPQAPVASTSPAPASPPVVTSLPKPSGARNWDQFRVQAAQRMVAANPAGSYSGPAPDPLLAIPVLEIELNGDGSVRRIGVSRMPRQAQDTVQLAIDAVRRAAPYGDVTRLPKPWVFSEVFLFDDNRRFKPRTLD